MMGLGFLAVLVLIGAIRELLGTGTLFAGMEQLFGTGGQVLRIEVLPSYRGFLLALLPTGAFFVFALLVAVRNAIVARAKPATSTPVGAT